MIAAIQARKSTEQLVADDRALRFYKAGLDRTTNNSRIVDFAEAGRAFAREMERERTRDWPRASRTNFQ